METEVFLRNKFWYDDSLSSPFESVKLYAKKIVSRTPEPRLRSARALSSLHCFRDHDQSHLSRWIVLSTTMAGLSYFCRWSSHTQESSSCNCRVRSNAFSYLSMNSVREDSIIPAFFVFPEALLNFTHQQNFGHYSCSWVLYIWLHGWQVSRRGSRNLWSLTFRVSNEVDTQDFATFVT